jgi:hypothetical protein
MRKQIATVLLGLSGISVLAGLALADEEKVPVDKLPEAVLKSIKRKFPKAEIEKAAKEVEDGKTVYEVELEIKDHAIDVSLKADGTVLEIEREIPVDELPTKVKKKLAAKYPGAKIAKAEEVTKGEDGPVRYEIAISTEVVLTAKGKIVRGNLEEDDETPTATDKKPSKREKEESEDDDDDKATTKKGEDE